MEWCPTQRMTTVNLYTLSQQSIRYLLSNKLTINNMIQYYRFNRVVSPCFAAVISLSSDNDSVINGIDFYQIIITLSPSVAAQD